MDAFQHDQHFFEATLKRAGRNKDLLERFPVSDHFCFADRKPFRENTVVSGGEEELAWIHFLFVLHVVDDGLRLALTLKGATGVVFLRNHSGSKAGVGHQHDERGCGIGVDHLANDPVRRDDGHARFYLAATAAVDEHYLRVVSGASADDAGGQCLGRRLRLKDAERMHAIRGR